MEEFIEGKFFGGELFVDMDKKSYKALGFQRMSFLGLFPAVLSKRARDFGARAKKLNLGGNMTVGDGFQNGGALVVEAGGKNTLFTYVQKDAPDHASNEEILKSLGIDEKALTAEDVTSTEAWT